MDRKKKITPITNADYKAVIDNSVQGVGSRLVGSAAEQKKLYVRPIANTDGTPNVLEKVQRLADEIIEVVKEGDAAVDILANALSEVAQALNTKLSMTDKPNKLYGTDKYGRSTVYELNDVGDIIGVDLGFEIVKELPQEGAVNVLYFIPIDDAEDDNLFEEWAWLNKGTEEEPAYGWERIGSKKVTIDHSEYVKFTDYASQDKAGVVKVSGLDYGLELYNGTIRVRQPSDWNIINARRNGSCSPVTLSKADLTVKEVLSNPREDVEWTDEDKAKACETIGAVAKKANTGSMNVVYGEEHSGKGPKMFTLASGGTGDMTIPMRNANGQFDVRTPQSDLNVANKKYVDDAIANIEVGGGTALFTHRVGCYVYDEINNDMLEAVLIFANTDDTSYAALQPEGQPVDVPPELISVFEDPSTSPNFVSLWIIEEGKYIATRMNVYEGRVYIEIARGEGITYLSLNGVMNDDVTDFGG